MTVRKTGISRRRFLRFGLEAVAAAGCVGAASALAHNGSYVRPPGAAEKLTGLCIRCGACVEACPERALKQLDLSLDFFNLGTPVLNYRRDASRGAYSPDRRRLKGRSVSPVWNPARQAPSM